jgi:hypothetical protein
MEQTQAVDEVLVDAALDKVEVALRLVEQAALGSLGGFEVDGQIKFWPCFMPR